MECLPRGFGRSWATENERCAPGGASLFLDARACAPPLPSMAETGMGILKKIRVVTWLHAVMTLLILSGWIASLLTGNGGMPSLLLFAFGALFAVSLRRDLRRDGEISPQGRFAKPFEYAWAAFVAIWIMVIVVYYFFDVMAYLVVD